MVTPKLSLTERERQVARLVAEGLGPKLISRSLSITEQGAKNILRGIHKKLGTDTCLDLCAYIWTKRRFRHASDFKEAAGIDGDS